MGWEEAKAGTLREWRRIRASIGSAEEIDLLADINAVCDLCQVASEEAADDADRCESCLGFQQFGGCQEANLAMSELVMDKDWDGLRRLVDDFVIALESLDTGSGRTPHDGSPPIPIGG
jgi:hypothetical protein